MTFSDIHQRVASDLSFDSFLGQLCQWFDALACVDHGDDCPCPWDITTPEWYFISNHSRVMYLMVYGA